MSRAKPAKADPPAAADAAAFDFEAAMADLESIVERLEQADVPLEEALKAFERGVALTRGCQQALRDAEQKVELLVTRADGSESTVPFADADGAGDA